VSAGDDERTGPRATRSRAVERRVSARAGRSTLAITFELEALAELAFELDRSHQPMSHH